MRRADRGSATIWMLGLAVMLLTFGGLALDFWRALAFQRELAAMADSAAIAAASGIAEDHYRETGDVVLDPARATDLALASVRFQNAEVRAAEVAVSPDKTEVTVLLEGAVELGLFEVFVGDTEPLTVRATATAAPRLVP